MTKQIIVVFLALSAAVLLIWYGTKVVEAPTDLPAYTFTSTSNESIEVRFDNKNDTAILSGAGYEDLVFTRAISASGARYENFSNNLILWNKGDEITLYRNDEVVFTGTTAPDMETSELEGTSWSWQYTELQDGEKIEAPTGDHFILTLEEEGRLSSTTDCNGVGGNYVLNGEVLSIGELMMTQMYCEGSIEGTYGEHLGLVNSYVIEGDTLRLNLNRDYGVMVFKRK